MRQIFRFEVLALALLCSAGFCSAGCGPGSYPVTRVIQGQARAGVYVSPYSYTHFITAELAVAHGDDALAIQEYALARTGPADDVYVIARMASALFRLGREADAMALLDEGDMLDPNSEALNLARGDGLRRRGDLIGAVRRYERAAGLATESAVPIHRLLSLVEEEPSAAVALRRLSDHGHSSSRLRARLVLALRDGEAAEAREAAMALLDVAPMFATELLALAEVQLAAGHSELAVRLLEHPSLQRAHTLDLRVRALAASGDKPSAVALVLLDHQHTPVERASWWLLLNEYALARQEAEDALNAGDESARIIAGESALGQEDFGAARAHFEQVQEGTGLDERRRLGLDAAATGSGE